MITSNFSRTDIPWKITQNCPFQRLRNLQPSPMNSNYEIAKHWETTLFRSRREIWVSKEWIHQESLEWNPCKHAAETNAQPSAEDISYPLILHGGIFGTGSGLSTPAAMTWNGIFHQSWADRDGSSQNSLMTLPVQLWCRYPRKVLQLLWITGITAWDLV